MTQYIFVLFFRVPGVAMRGFMKCYGCRISVMVGGILSATGLALAMVVTDLYQVYLSYGLLTGMTSIY